MLKKISSAKLDNLHIFIWLIKDIMWMMEVKLIGVMMIIPAFGIALILTIKTYNFKSKFFGNLAVTFWISANSIWMLSEFYIWTIEWLAFGMFLFGIVTMAYYYLFVQKVFQFKTE
jgi:hypothetical protein